MNKLLYDEQEANCAKPSCGSGQTIGEPKEESIIAQEMNKLRSAEAVISELRDRIEKRLSDILTGENQTPTLKDANMKEPTVRQPLCPLANDIRAVRQDLMASAACIQRIIDRLEI